MKIVINTVQPVRGGNINSCFRLTEGKDSFFLKLNAADRYPGIFEQEFQGLTILGYRKVLKVPQPLLAGHEGPDAYLVTEWLEKGKPDSRFWENFARGLAGLHQQTHPYFGLDHDNYIGHIPQSNSPQKNWTEFYRLERLEPMLKAAENLHLLEKAELDRAAKLCLRLKDIFPEEKPALLHGDLWAGNFLVGKDGQACIFDPAIYFGHREMDLAMTRLFGGFDRKFYDFYEAYYPLEPGWNKRIEICQLYPLLVHLILFGGSYLQQVRKILRLF